MSYLGMNIPHPDTVFPDDKFISIVIPTYCRPYYLKQLLDSISEHADMYYEVIVCDDGSPQIFRDEVYKMTDKVSLYIVNNGWNAGLPTSANRVISLASSKYVLFLNDDCFFVEKCFKEMCDVLSKPYIGWISPMNDIGPFGGNVSTCKANDTEFAITNYLGGGAAIAFRKDVWQEVNGWDYKATSGQADNVFVYKIARAGYFKAVIEGHERIKTKNHDTDYKPTQPFSAGNDCSIPRMFGLSDHDWVEINHMRRIACQYWVDGERTIPDREKFDTRPNPIAGLNDHPYWGDYFIDMFGGGHYHDAHKIDWEVAKRHGQNKWEDVIKKDFGIS